MSTKEIIFYFISVFIAGIAIAQVIETDLSSATPILAMVGAFLAIIFNRLKHIDDLNLKLKKDISLQYVGVMSNYIAVLNSYVDIGINWGDVEKDLARATKKNGCCDE